MYRQRLRGRNVWAVSWGRNVWAVSWGRNVWAVSWGDKCMDSVLGEKCIGSVLGEKYMGSVLGHKRKPDFPSWRRKAGCVKARKAPFQRQRQPAFPLGPDLPVSVSHIRPAVFKQLHHRDHLPDEGKGAASRQRAGQWRCGRAAEEPPGPGEYRDSKRDDQKPAISLVGWGAGGGGGAHLGAVHAQGILRVRVLRVAEKRCRPVDKGWRKGTVNGGGRAAQGQ